MVWTHIAPKKMIGSDMRSMVDSKGFEPSTSRMRTERSPEWSAEQAHLRLFIVVKSSQDFQHLLREPYLDFRILVIFRVPRNDPIHIV